MLCQFQCALEELMGAHLMDKEPHRVGDVNFDRVGENLKHPRR
jgi:hypothetical protein